VKPRERGAMGVVRCMFLLETRPLGAHFNGGLPDDNTPRQSPSVLNKRPRPEASRQRAWRQVLMPMLWIEYPLCGCCTTDKKGGKPSVDSRPEELTQTENVRFALIGSSDCR
jgi:hypothetical protein